MTRFSLLLITLLISPRIFSATIFVTASGAGAMNGTAWANAYPASSLQIAINSAASGDEVWVACGTYFTTTGTTRTIAFNMKNGVSIYGSYQGTETLLSQRILTCGPCSVLSAEIGAAGNADNSYHVVSNININPTAVLDGFVLTGGNANFVTGGAYDDRNLGGGMYNGGNNSGLASPTVRNCVFRNNSAEFGGGMFNSGFTNGVSNPNVSNCVFVGNNATGGGAGMDNFGYGNGNANPVLTNCLFVNNVAAQAAGGMYCWGGGNGSASPTILNCSFINNSVTAGNGDGIIVDRLDFGGGSSSGSANAVVRNSIFWGNTAAAGPQFFSLGAGTFTATYSDVDLTNQTAPHIISGAGTGNINSNPSFINIADPDGNDNCWMTNDDGLLINAASPCLNVGDNSGVSALDIRFQNRIINTTVDMGAYEFNAILVLPVSLRNFSAVQVSNAVRLQWETISEKDNSLFEVERSIDGNSFESIGKLSGKGNSFNRSQYIFHDHHPYKQVNYYRLKQIDRDGQFNYSSIETVRVVGKEETIVVYNVLNNCLNIRIPSASIPAIANMVNMNGQVIQKIKLTGAQTSIDLSSVQNGTYVIQLSTGGAYKFIKNK